MAAWPFPGLTLKIHSPGLKQPQPQRPILGRTIPEGSPWRVWTQGASGRVTTQPVQPTELEPNHSSSAGGSWAHSLASVFSTEKWTINVQFSAPSLLSPRGDLRSK